MRLIQRVGYYLGGFSIGLIFLAFFLSGKRASCSYGPNARVLKNISKKELVYSQKAVETIKRKAIDSLIITETLKFGEVDFSKLDRSSDSCKIYILNSDFQDKKISMTVENCNTVATIKSIDFN